MGAAAEHRGNRAIREGIEREQHEDPHYGCNQAINYLQAENRELKDRIKGGEYLAERLIQANALIERLRAENAVLKDEKARFISVVEGCKRHISVAGNCHKKYGVALVKSQLQKARLI